MLAGRGGIETLVQCDLSPGMAILAAANGQPTVAGDEEFLPFTGGDLTGLPFIKNHALRIYWALTDRLKDKKKAPRDWRWVGNRSPLAPPEI